MKPREFRTFSISSAWVASILSSGATGRPLAKGGYRGISSSSTSLSGNTLTLGAVSITPLRP
ncbi:hypothetical protein P3686_26795, partial [Vibrio parahaemolyticus]|nr:hypothetical protein [Vibrio parahaemolyticus]